MRRLFDWVLGLKIELAHFLYDNQASGATTKMALIKAAENWDLEKVKQLLERGTYVNAKNRDGMTALMVAAEDGQTEIVKVLLDANAHVNAKDIDGWTALMWAANLNHVEVVKALLTKSPDLNVVDDHHNSALVFAAHRDNLEIAQMLLKHGAVITADTMNVAVNWEHTNIVCLFQAENAWRKRKDLLAARYTK